MSLVRIPGERAVERVTAAPPDVSALVALFHQARYSNAPPSSDDAERARLLLGRLLAQMESRR